MFHDTEEWYKVLKKLTLGSKKDEKFDEVSPNHSKVKKLNFDGLFLSKI